nr:YqaE/Pmp3 family membrane protein [uncultured Rhodopila sp.]
MIALAILLPWLSLMIGGHFFRAILCLALQITVVGWIPAAVWAVFVVNADRRDQQYRQMLRILHGRG